MGFHRHWSFRLAAIVADLVGGRQLLRCGVSAEQGAPNSCESDAMTTKTTSAVGTMLMPRLGQRGDAQQRLSVCGMGGQLDRMRRVRCIVAGQEVSNGAAR